MSSDNNKTFTDSPAPTVDHRYLDSGSSACYFSQIMSLHRLLVTVARQPQVLRIIPWSEGRCSQRAPGQSRSASAYAGGRAPTGILLSTLATRAALATLKLVRAGGCRDERGALPDSSTNSASHWTQSSSARVVYTACPTCDNPQTARIPWPSVHSDWRNPPPSIWTWGKSIPRVATKASNPLLDIE